MKTKGIIIRLIAAACAAAAMATGAAAGNARAEAIGGLVPDHIGLWRDGNDLRLRASD